MPPLHESLRTASALLALAAALPGCLNGTTPQPPPRVPKPKIEAPVVPPVSTPTAPASEMDRGRPATRSPAVSLRMPAQHLRAGRASDTVRARGARFGT